MPRKRKQSIRSANTAASVAIGGAANREIVGPPRRTLKEFLHRAKAEPTLNSVVVEGNYDQELIKWLMRSQGLGSTTSVLRIDQIEIPKEILGAYQNNHRGRVIALAAKAQETSVGNVFCLVDSDFDNIISGLPDITGLHVTDFSSAELYLYTDSILDRYLGLVCRSNIKLATFKSDMEAALIPSFRIRLANEELGWRLRIVSLERDLVYLKGRVQYDNVTHISRLLDSNQRRRDRELFESTYHGRSVEGCDPRNVIHGHDFLEYLAWYANEAIGELQNRASVTRLLAGFGTPDCYLSYPRIARLISLLT